MSFDLYQWIQSDLSHAYFLLLLSLTYSVLLITMYNTGLNQSCYLWSCDVHQASKGSCNDVISGPLSIRSIIPKTTNWAIYQLWSYLQRVIEMQLLFEKKREVNFISFWLKPIEQNVIALKIELRVEKCFNETLRS